MSTGEDVKEHQTSYPTLVIITGKKYNLNSGKVEMLSDDWCQLRVVRERKIRYYRRIMCVEL